MEKENLQKNLLRLGDLYLQYKDRKTEIIYIRNESVEIGIIDEKPSILKYCKKAKDLYKEQQDDGVVGTTLVNFLNVSNTIKERLNKYLDTIKQYDEYNKDINTTHYELLNLITDWQNDLVSTINSFPLSVILYKIFANFKKDYVISDLYNFMENCKAKKDKSNYYKEMYNYINKIIDKTVERSKWFNKFSKKEMVTIFLKSLMIDIDFIILNCKNNILDYPAFAKSCSCKIETLLDLFYVSKYHIQDNRKELKICENCNRYFITKFKRNEKYCKRKVKDYNYTCSELASKNYRGKSEYSNIRKELSIVENAIYSMLRQRDKRSGTKELEKFKIKQKNIYTGITHISTTEKEETQRKIEWIKNEHKRLKQEK